MVPTGRARGQSEPVRLLATVRFDPPTGRRFTDDGLLIKRFRGPAGVQWSQLQRGAVVDESGGKGAALRFGVTGRWSVRAGSMTGAGLEQERDQRRGSRELR